MVRRCYVTMDLAPWELPRRELTIAVTTDDSHDPRGTIEAAVIKANKRYFRKWGCLLEERHCHNLAPDGGDASMLSVHVLHLHCRHWRSNLRAKRFQEAHGVDQCIACVDLFAGNSETQDWTFCPLCFEMEHQSTFIVSKGGLFVQMREDWLFTTNTDTTATSSNPAVARIQFLVAQMTGAGSFGVLEGTAAGTGGLRFAAQHFLRGHTAKAASVLLTLLVAAELQAAEAAIGDDAQMQLHEFLVSGIHKCLYVISIMHPYIYYLVVLTNC